MKTIGLIGGMSWESTVTYYRIINNVVKEKLGGFHSAKCVLCSVDFHEIEEYQSSGDWDKSADVLINAARSLEKAGADFVIICTNTMHKVADRVKNAVSIPLMHIAEATADELIKSGIKTVALIGTKYTMEQDFYKSKITSRGISVIIPDEKDRETVNSTIYNELCLGTIKETSRDAILKIVKKLTDNGAEGVILGCTEIGLLVSQDDTDTQLFDTTLIHATKAAMFSIN